MLRIGIDDGRTGARHPACRELSGDLLHEGPLLGLRREQQGPAKRRLDHAPQIALLLPVGFRLESSRRTHYRALGATL